MIVRLVKMTFRPEEAGRFQELFEGWRQRIGEFPGCRKLELLHDIHRPGIFFTQSEWDSEQHLAAYRSSSLFAEVWPQVKPLFAAPAEAWSVRREYQQDINPPAPLSHFA